MSEREALRIVRILIKTYEAGASDTTLATYLRQQLKKANN